MPSRDGGDESSPWIVVVVRPRAERKVQTGLASAGLETFVPWRKVRRHWSDRVKMLEQNLFPGYIFCRSTFSERHLVMGQPGVERVVSFDHQPTNIPEEEILALRRAVQSGLPMLPWPFLKAGQRVRIERGVLEGIEGTLAKDSDTTRVVVSVDVLQRSVAVEVNRDIVLPLSGLPSSSGVTSNGIEGNSFMAVTKPRNRALIFRLTQDEYETLRVASTDQGARSLSEFARVKLLGALGDPALYGEISELRSTIARLAERLERS